MAFNDKKDQLCMNCGAVMFNNVQLDAEGHVAVNTFDEIELRKLKTICNSMPRCGAKNCVELETGSHGLPLVRFTQVKS